MCAKFTEPPKKQRDILLCWTTKSQPFWDGLICGRGEKRKSDIPQNFVYRRVNFAHSSCMHLSFSPLKTQLENYNLVTIFGEFQGWYPRFWGVLFRFDRSLCCEIIFQADTKLGVYKMHAVPTIGFRYEWTTSFSWGNTACHPSLQPLTCLLSGSPMLSHHSLLKSPKFLAQQEKTVLNLIGPCNTWRFGNHKNGEVNDPIGRPKVGSLLFSAGAPSTMFPPK